MTINFNSGNMKNVILIFAFVIAGTLSLIAQSSKGTANPGFLNKKVNFAGVDSGEIEKSVLIKSKKLSFDEKASSGYKITTFKMTLVTKEGDQLSFGNDKDGELTAAMLEALAKAPAGSKLFFEYIRCVDENGVSHALQAIHYVLK